MPKKKSIADRRYKRQFDAAIGLYRAGQMALSVEALKLLALEYPNSAAVHLYLGLVLMKLEQPSLASRHFEVATRLAPTSEKASLGLFHSLIDSKKRRDAIAELKRFQAVAHSEDYVALAEELGIVTTAAA